MTYRRLQVFIDRLPPESSTKTAIRDDLGEVNLAKMAQEQPQDGYGPWSHTDMRLAALIDKVSWLIYAVYHAQGGKPKEPKQFPRPGVLKDGAAVRVLNEQQRSYLEQVRARNHAAWRAQGVPEGQWQQLGYEQATPGG